MARKSKSGRQRTDWLLQSCAINGKGGALGAGCGRAGGRLPCRERELSRPGALPAKDGGKQTPSVRVRRPVRPSVA